MQQRVRFWICLVLGGVTFLIYLPVFSHTFVNYDDDEYVYENDQVQRGFDTAMAVQFGITAGRHPILGAGNALRFT